MIRKGDWKYCYYLDGSEELYDLQADPGEWHNLADDAAHSAARDFLRAQAIEFWQPDQYLQRLAATPMARREKHFYEFSNQFLLGDGTVADARP